MKYHQSFWNQFLSILGFFNIVKPFVQITDQAYFFLNSTATPVPVILLKTTSETQIELTDLSDQHIYNISVAAATSAGYGQPVFIQVTTCKWNVLI